MINDLSNNNRQRLPMPLTVLDNIRDLDQIDSVVNKYFFDHFGILGQNLVLIYVDQKERVAIYEVTGECNASEIRGTYQPRKPRAQTGRRTESVSCE